MGGRELRRFAVAMSAKRSASRRMAVPVERRQRLVGPIVLMLAIATAAGCKPTIDRADDRRSGGSRVPATSASNAAQATRPRQRSTPLPPTPSPPALSLLGAWQTLEGTGFDVVFHGQDAGFVAGVEIAGNQCTYQSQKSTRTMRFFRCIGPLLEVGTEERTEFARVTYNNGAPATNAGGFVFRNQASWRQYNGEYYMESLWNYLVNASSTEGPTISLDPRTLPGYVGDPTLADQAAVFNAVKLNGNGGAVNCPTIGHFQYKCPPIREGIYSIDILFEQSTRYIASNTFIAKVVYGPLDPPAPETGNTPDTHTPPNTAPQCDPTVTKGC